MSNKALKTEKGDKVQAARERNRIHSRQTRLRRKARSTNLEGKILELQKEGELLQNLLERIDTANVLINMKINTHQSVDSNTVVSDILQQKDIIEAIKSKVRTDAQTAFNELMLEETANRKDKKEGDESEEEPEEEKDEEIDGADGGFTGDGDDPDDLFAKHKGAKFTRKEMNRIHSKLTRLRRKMLANEMQKAVGGLEKKNTEIQNTFKMLTQNKKAKKNILLVDDSSVVQKLTKNILERNGFEVSISANGLQAIESINSSNSEFDVILMDLEMPVMNGIDAMKNIRRQERYVSGNGDKIGNHNGLTEDALFFDEYQPMPLPSPATGLGLGSTRATKKSLIIALSGHSEEATMKEAFRAGADAFITKPFDYQLFEETVTSFICFDPSKDKEENQSSLSLESKDSHHPSVKRELLQIK